MQQSKLLSLQPPLDLLLSISQAMQSSANGKSMWKAHCWALMGLGWFYIYRLLTAVTDNLRSIHESIKAIATAVAISLIPYCVPQKVTEMESWATGRAAVHRQFQWAGKGSLWVLDTLLFSHFSRSLFYWKTNNCTVNFLSIQRVLYLKDNHLMLR